MVFGWIIIVTGAALALYGLYMTVSFARLTPRLTSRTPGKLVGFAYGTTRRTLRRPEGKETRELVHLKVAYQAEGRSYVLPERQTLSSEKGYAPGMALEVLYDPRKPEDFRVAGNRADLNSGLMLMGVGALFVAGALLLMYL